MVIPQSSQIYVDELKDENLNENVGNVASFSCVGLLNSDVEPATTTTTSYIEEEILLTSHLSGAGITNTLPPLIPLCSPQNHYAEESETDKLRMKKKMQTYQKHTLHDPTINNVIVSKSTLKYAIIALLTLGLLASFLYLLIIGVLYQDACFELENNANFSNYLIVMGIVGCVRIATFFSCPFDYSKSILSKMYEHLVWRLLVNRFKTNYHEVARKKTLRMIESPGTVRGIYFRLSCFSSFLFSYFCCNFHCLFSLCKRDDLDEDDENNIESKGGVRMAPSFVTIEPPEVRFSLWENSDPLNANTLSKSVSDLSGITETTMSSKQIILNELNCFKPFEKVTKHQNSRAKDLSKTKFDRNELSSSNSSSTISHTKGTAAKKVKFSHSNSSNVAANAPQTIGPNSSANYGQRYFSGKHNYKYGTHKRLKRHHNKTQRPIRLFDFNSIRYGVSYLLQRALDIFMICWFVCGNYWVFNANLSELDGLFDQVDNTSTLSEIKNASITTKSAQLKSRQIRQVFLSLSLNNHSIEARTILTCYNTAFLHILTVYSLIGFIVFIAISFQFYLVIRSSKKDPIEWNNRNDGSFYFKENTSNIFKQSDKYHRCNDTTTKSTQNKP